MSTLSSHGRAPRGPRFFAVLLVVIGLVLGLGGVKLATLGGSLYYLIAGSGLIACGVLLWRGNRWGARLYALLTLCTILWALWEVGFDGWALAPRVLPFLVLGLVLLLPGVRRRLAAVQPRPLRRTPLAWAWVAGLVALCIGVALREPYPTLAFPAAAAGMSTQGSGDWLHYGRTAAGTRYAPFEEINAANVSGLEVAWTYRTGVGGAFKATPLQVGDTLYVCLARNIITALDADSGDERWRFDPKLNDSKLGFTTTCRGLTYYKSPEPLAECNERILTATTDARLIAVDARTGARCSSFGVNGEVNLLAGMGAVKPGFYYVTSPATMVRGVAVLGGWVADNVETAEPSGVIRGFDALTGQLKWAWDLGRPDVLTAPAEGQTYTRGTPNAWSVFSADEELGLVYIPTGNATPDYYGGHRSPESEKFASSVVALDAQSGALRWSFQTTHHDIWDYDVPSQPVLVDLPAEGGGVTRALVAPTKRGELFLLDRTTGEPVAAVEEREVPQTDVPQEWTSKTQPFSVGMPSFGRDLVTEQKMWGVTPIDQMLCRIKFRELRYEGPLTPPSIGGSLQYPGFAGGMNWGSVAIDETNHVMITNALQIGNHVRLYPRDRSHEGDGARLRWRHAVRHALCRLHDAVPLADLRAVPAASVWRDCSNRPQLETGALATTARVGDRARPSRPQAAPADPDGRPLQRRQHRHARRPRVHGRRDGSAHTRTRHQERRDPVDARSAQQRASDAHELCVARDATTVRRNHSAGDGDAGSKPRCRTGSEAGRTS